MGGSDRTHTAQQHSSFGNRLSIVIAILSCILGILSVSGNVVYLLMGCDLSRDSPRPSGSPAVSGTQIHVYMGNNVDRPASAVKPAPLPKKHNKCRNCLYPRGDHVERFPVPDIKISWDIAFEDYRPIDFTADSVLKQPVWADVDFRKDNTVPVAWNKLDGKINRRSHTGDYKVQGNVPLNPVGRTGMVGRGSLGRWGPNHAADPIVTRWKRDESHKIMQHPKTGRNILQFIAIQRRDTHEWAIPGGMVDAGEKVSVTLKREFSEEAMNTLQATPEQKKQIEENITELFNKGTEIYRGYVDDPRNTDNSWMETVAVNFHDKTGHSVGQFKLHAGDDAVGVRWADVSEDMRLYASHEDFIKSTARNLNAHW